jgi:aspartyl protease family protein
MEPEPLKADATTGRLMRYTLRLVAGSLVVTGLVAWLLVSHTPAPAGHSMPRAAASSSSSTLFYRAASQMSFPRGGDGRYYVAAAMNEREIRFVVDAGTPTVMLSRNDARAAGIDISKLSFSSKVATPVGEMRAASVILPMLTVKQLTLFNVSAVIAEGALPSPILGLAFLKRFDSYDLREDELVLRW